MNWLSLIQKVPFLGTVIKDFLAILFLVFTYVWAEETANTGVDKPAPGPEKKATVVKQIHDILANPGGMDWPSYLPATLEDVVIGLLIDAICALAKRLGNSKPSTNG